jgi:hypothetical protein
MLKRKNANAPQTSKGNEFGLTESGGTFDEGPAANTSKAFFAGASPGGGHVYPEQPEPQDDIGAKLASATLGAATVGWSNGWGWQKTLGSAAVLLVSCASAHEPIRKNYQCEHWWGPAHLALEGLI